MDDRNAGGEACATPTGFLRQFCPHLCVRRVEEIDLAALRARGIRALLLDLDNTLTAWRGYEMTPELQAWLEQAQRGFRLCLVSNQFRGRRVREIAAQLGISCVHGLGPAGKPGRRIFRRAAAQIGVPPEQTAMIGDQMFSDICGARRAGMYAILVEPIGTYEFLTTAVMRRVTRWVERVLRKRGEWPEG
jgi:HAD superfamily phosphatase (TIGR01668 family)